MLLRDPIHGLVRFERDAERLISRLLDTREVQRLRRVRQLGLACDDSHANFVLARASDAAEADAVEAALNAAGILIRRVAGYGFPEGLRITVGDAQQTGRVIDALTKWREGVAA